MSKFTGEDPMSSGKPIGPEEFSEKIRAAEKTKTKMIRLERIKNAVIALLVFLLYLRSLEDED